MNTFMTTNRKSRYPAAELADRLILAGLLAGIGMFIIYPICSVVVTSFFKDGHFTVEYYQAHQKQPEGGSPFFCPYDRICILSRSGRICGEGKKKTVYPKQSGIYHDLSALCIISGLYHAVWAQGPRDVPASRLKCESLRLARCRDPSGHRQYFLCDAYAVDLL